MVYIIKKYKKILKDFFYSVVAYALPTFVLQFIVQPLIANGTSADENGLFVTLFNVVKLTISIFILPLANLRLLNKKECEINNNINSFFNCLFNFVLFFSMLLGTVLNIMYRHKSLNFLDIVSLCLLIILMSIHDYFSISFRIAINYKKIIIDNLLIILGYGIGAIFFIYFGRWECIFISGYLFGTIYVLINTKIWKSWPIFKNENNLIKQYSELSTSYVLSNISIYCDRLIIYPVLGGYAVSVYNAAAVVSKAISLISAPLRNVLLSYIVNNEKLTIKKSKIIRYLPLLLCGIIFIFLFFWGFSIIACTFLYPKYVSAAKLYIPFIIVSIMLETIAGIMNVVLLRYAKTKIQTIISAIKLVVYLISVIVLSIIFKFGLWGFCFAVLLASIAHIIAVTYILKKNINLID